MATLFRLCSPDDTEHLLGLITDWHRIEGLPLDVPTARDNLDRLLSDNRLGHAWVIERGGLAAGYVMLSFSETSRTGEPRAYAAALYVDPRQRGRGLAARARGLLHDVARFLHVPVLFFDADSEAKHAALLQRPLGVAADHSTPELRQAVA